MIERIRFSWIIVAASLVALGWALIAAHYKIEQIYDVIMQVVFLASGAYATYLKGESDSQKSFKLQARERYRRLRTLFESIRETSDYLYQIEAAPSLTGEQEFGGNLEDYKKASFVVFSRCLLWTKNIEDCLHFWNDFAPEQVGQMHQDAFGEDDDE